MYLKVLIMEIKEDYCLAMTEDGEVIRIKRKKGMKVGGRIYVLREDVIDGSMKQENSSKVIPFYAKKGRSSWKGMPAAAALVAVTAGMLLYTGAAKVSYAAVSVDGDMSIQMELDKDCRIKSAVSYDGSVPEEVLKKLKGMNLMEAKRILSGNEDKEEQWLVSYALYRGNKGKDVEKELTEAMATKDTFVVKGDKEDLKAAEEMQKTLGLFLMEKAAEEDVLEEFFEELPPEKIAAFLELNPELGKYAELFKELEEELEEDIEEAKEEKEEKEKEKAEKEKEKAEEEKERQEELLEEKKEQEKEKEEDRPSVSVPQNETVPEQQAPEIEEEPADDPEEPEASEPDQEDYDEPDSSDEEEEDD